MSVTIKEDAGGSGWLPSASSSPKLLIVGIVILGIGCVLIWYFLIRKKNTSDGKGGSPPPVPPRGTLQEYPGYKGIVEPVEKCSAAGQRCMLPDDRSIGLCAAASPSQPTGHLFDCKPIKKGSAGWADSSQDCLNQCNALVDKTGDKSACYYANYNAGLHTCLLCPLKPDALSERCSMNKDTSWVNWAPALTGDDCANLANEVPTYPNTNMGGQDLANVDVPSMKACAVEVMLRNAATSSLPNGPFYAVYEEVPETADADLKRECHIRSASIKVDPEGDCVSKHDSSNYTLIRSNIDASVDCENVVKVSKKGDFTSNPHLRSRKTDKQVTSPDQCSKACAEDSSKPGLAGPRFQAASQWFADTNECWCYDWPYIDDESVFCSDQSPGNAKNEKQQPPIYVNKALSPNITKESVKPNTACAVNTYNRGSCWMDKDGTKKNTCVPGFSPYYTRLPKDHDYNGTQCRCIPNTDFDRPRLGLFEVVDADADPSSRPPQPQYCAGGSYVTGGKPDSKEELNGHFCSMTQANLIAAGGPCVESEKCSTKYCKCGWYWDEDSQGWFRQDDCAGIDKSVDTGYCAFKK